MWSRRTNLQRHAQVLVVKSKDVSNSDEDLKIQPVLVKRSTPRKPFGSSLDRSNNPVDIPTTAHYGKLWYDPVQVQAMKLRQEMQDIPGIKRDQRAGAV